MLSAGWRSRLLQILDLERQSLLCGGLTHRTHFCAQFHGCVRIGTVTRPVDKGFSVWVPGRRKVYPIGRNGVGHLAINLHNRMARDVDGSEHVRHLRGMKSAEFGMLGPW